MYYDNLKRRAKAVKARKEQKREALAVLDRIDLKQHIAPVYFPIHEDIQAGMHTVYNLPGGRGSCKSSFVSLEIVKGIMDDPTGRSNAIVFQASLELIRGNASETIVKLEHRKNPFYMMDGADSLLIQAYRVAGQTEEASEWNQVTMYRNLFDLIQGSMLYLMNHIQDVERAKSTVKRLEVLMQAYEVKELNPNAYLQFVYIKAMHHMTCEEQELTLSELREFVMEAINFLTGDIRMKGDAYFDKLDGYFERMDEYLMLPRNPQMVLSTLAQDLSNPVFTPLFDNPEYQKLLALLK